MTHRSAAAISSLLIAAMLAGSLWTLVRLPADARVPVHFGFDGAGDAWMAPWPGLFFLPAAAAVVWVLFLVLPHIDPRGDNLIQSSKAYGTIWLGLIALLAAVHGVMLAAAFYIDIGVSRWVTVLTGALFVVMGNVLGKVRPNYTLGVRTLWTLADPHVWDKTHRFAGWLFVIGGLVLMIAAAAMPIGPMLSGTLIVVVVSVTFLSIAKSYALWRGRNRGRA